MDPDLQELLAWRHLEVLVDRLHQRAEASSDEDWAWCLVA